MQILVGVLGAALLVAGVVSRLPNGGWWRGADALGEQFATLIAPCLGLMLLSGSVLMGATDGSAVETVFLVLFGIGLIGGIWVVLSLPIPDRWLVRDSYILRDRKRRRSKRGRS